MDKRRRIKRKSGVMRVYRRGERRKRIFRLESGWRGMKRGGRTRRVGMGGRRKRIWR